METSQPQNRPRPQKVLRSAMVFFKPYGGQCLAGAVLLLFSTALMLVFPWWSDRLFSEIFPARDLPLLIRHLGLGILLLLPASLTAFARDFYLARMAYRMAMSLRTGMFRTIINRPVHDLEKQGPGEMLSKMGADTALFQASLVGVMGNLVPQGMILLLMLGCMTWYSWPLTLLTALLLAPAAGVMWGLGKRIVHTVHAAQSHLAKLTGLVEESFAGMREIYTLNRHKAIEEEFERVGNSALNAQSHQALFQSILPPATLFLVTLELGAMCAASAWLYWSGIEDAGNLAAFFTCLGMAIAPLSMVSDSIQHISRGYATLARCMEDISHEHADMATGLAPMPRLRGGIKVDEVSFTYGGSLRPALDRITLHVEPGQTIALVGPSGGGKSTLIDLLLGFGRPDSGAILMDGQDISCFDPLSLYAQMGVVFQNPMLFTGTLWDNLTAGCPDATEDEVWEACSQARVEDFIRGLPQGLNTWLDHKGSNLSQGQRQRMAIARALIKDPPILLLDEPTSALDAHSESLVLETLASLRGTRTLIVASHLLPVVREADQAWVMDQGRIVEEGTHHNLINAGGLYASLCASQHYPTLE